MCVPIDCFFLSGQDIVCAQMDDFEKELKALRQRMSRRSPTIGTKEEMQKMSQDTNKMSTFCKDITSTTKVGLTCRRTKVLPTCMTTV